MNFEYKQKYLKYKYKYLYLKYEIYGGGKINNLTQQPTQQQVLQKTNENLDLKNIHIKRLRFEQKYPWSRYA